MLLFVKKTFTDMACMPLFEAEIDRDELRSLKHLIECKFSHKYSENLSKTSRGRQHRRLGLRQELEVRWLRHRQQLERGLLALQRLQVTLQRRAIEEYNWR